MTVLLHAPVTVFASASSRSGPNDTPGILPDGFRVPADLSAREPAEARGLARDEVRLLVSRSGGERGSGADDAEGTEIERYIVGDLPDVLRPGDLLVVNNSGTLPAALDAVDQATGTRVVLHVSTGTPESPEAWIVELRRPRDDGSTAPFALTPDSADPQSPATKGARLRVAGGATVTLLRRHTQRLWLARLDLGMSVADYLHRHGRPIRYSYVDRDWPLATYQTAFATVPGSAEMPSAARPFTPDLVTRLVSAGVHIAPITLVPVKSAC
jgi:S-adenosylmethionine:tRNA ribosyltransferase-isomerase